MQNLERNDTNELIYKTETDLGNEFMVMWVGKEGKSIVREFGINMYTLLYLKWINKYLLYSTRNFAKYCVTTKWERNF